MPAVGLNDAEGAWIRLSRWTLALSPLPAAKLFGAPAIPNPPLTVSGRSKPTPRASAVKVTIDGKQQYRSRWATQSMPPAASTYSAHVARKPGATPTSKRSASVLVSAPTLQAYA